MDDRRFDRLIRALGGGVSRRGALSALAGMAAGLGLGLDGRESDAKKRRKKCDPPCAAGQSCRQGTCTCDNGGTVCGASCCTGGQRCEGGQCVSPEPACIAAGERCKDTGRPCCAGTVCASGQGGKGDVACYKPAGVACETTADCVYDATCKDGICIANPQPVPAPACVPSFPVTGDAAANGRALQAAWEQAQGAEQTEIALAPGAYDLGQFSGTTPVALPWQATGEVTLRGCGSGVILRDVNTIAAPGMLVVGTGTVTFTGLTLDGGASTTAAGVTAQGGAVTLDGCTVTGFDTWAVDAQNDAKVTIVGGTFHPDGPGDGLYSLFRDGTATFTCSGNPSAKLCRGFTDVPNFVSCGCQGSF